MDNLGIHSFTSALSPLASWHRYEEPFRHVLARDVLRSEAYGQLEARALALLAGANGKTENYDACIRRIDDQIAPDLAPLFCPEWFSLVRAALGVDTNNQVDAAIHDHPEGSRAGWAHNDFNPGRFFASPDPGQVFSAANGVEYRVRAGADTTGASMRKIAGLFYLGNSDWSPEHGGETGLYWNSGQWARLAKRIAPVNNSLLLFECSPHSFHGFLGTHRQRRSIVFWLHCPITEALERWPSAEPAYWP